MQYLIIPSGGSGKRFLSCGYKVYKPFLKVSKNTRVIDNIIDNFPKNNTHIIIIGNEKRFNNIKLNLKVKRISFIKIKDHKYGPLYSIYLAKESIKKIVKDNNFFVSYSDINWKWNFKIVKKFIQSKNVVIFSHNGFHPHLEVDSKSDFFLNNKNNFVTRVSEKKRILKDYKKNNLALGCYYFKNFKYFETFFDSQEIKRITKKKEIYIINLLEFLIKIKIKINYFDIKKFVHLGTPNQYENFLYWKKIIFEKNEKKKYIDFSSVMLMAGKGKRVRNLNEKKPFLKFKKKNIYEYIFSKFLSKANYIITNDSYFRLIDKKFKIHKIQKTNSMLHTVEKSVKFLKGKKNFFILSCDCFGNFNYLNFKKFIKEKDPDVVVFPFTISDLQKTLPNSHTTIEIFDGILKSINIKKFIDKKNVFGHAGFFWIKNTNVFNDLEKFRSLNVLKREVLLDDYFKFLFDKKISKVHFFMLDEYVHVGSVNEYLEAKYWENYFIDENK